MDIPIDKPLVLVTWLDAKDGQTGWHSLDDIEKEKFYKSYTRAHQQTSEYINNIIKKSNLNCKIINLNFVRQIDV